MIEFVGEYYDGHSSHPNPAVITVYETNVLVKCLDVTLDIPLSQIAVDPTVGSARAIIRLKHDAEIHSSDTETIRLLEIQLKPVTPENIARHPENRLLYVALTLVVAISIVASLLQWGLPAFAEYSAAVFPSDAEYKIGAETLKTLDDLYLNPSRLPLHTQHELNARLQQLCTHQECPPFELLFRNSQSLGANAFALPGNRIVITDQLIEKSKHDEEIFAVLFHELGHIKERHVVQMMLQSIGSGIVLLMITGEISNYSDLAAGLPAILLQQGYSRDIEDEADRFALNALQKAHIPPHRFADILLRIDPDANDSATLFSSHPDTRKRIQMFL